MTTKESVSISSPKEKYFLVETVKPVSQQKKKLKFINYNISNQNEIQAEDENNIDIKECSYKLNEKDYYEILSIQIESINNLCYTINNIFSELISENKTDKFTQILYFLFSLRLKIQNFFSIFHKCNLPKIFEKNSIKNVIRIKEKLIVIMNTTKKDFEPNIGNILEIITNFSELFKF